MMRYGEVDGVPTLLAPSSGPMHAGLAFRVGRADELLSRSGITHLLEHLVLHRLGGPADYHYNGATGGVVTLFHSQGAPEDVAAFLNGVCAGLADLPLARLEQEKEILRTEEAGRAPSVAEPLAVWRYGAQDHGLVGFGEMGLSMLEPDDLRRWAAYWFTRENAVLWIAGDRIPPGLRLHLPSGARRPVPPPSSALPETPAYFTGGDRVVAMDGLVPRGAPAAVLTQYLERQLFRALRQEGGYSYTAAAGFEPRGDGYGTITAMADSAPHLQGPALGEFVDVLAALRVGRIPDADVTAATGALVRSLDRPDADAARLPAAALDLLTGHRVRALDEVRADLLAVTAADVGQAARHMLDSALLMTPAGLPADWAGYAAAPARSPDAVAGRRITSRSGAGPQVVVAPDGVSLTDGPEALTVRYATAVALLQWPDGARELVGPDAIRVRLEPTLYDLDTETLAAVDRTVPPLRHVRMPARDPGHIPVARPARADRKAAATGGRGERMTAGLLGFVATALSILASLVTVAAFRNDRHEAGEWVAVAIVWLLAALFYLPARLLRRRGAPSAAPDTPG